MALTEDREKARRVATGIVSVAIALAGVTIVILAVTLVVRGGLGFLFLSLLLGVLGAGLALLGFFFQLVPFRLAELEQEKRDYDARVRRP